MNDDPEVIQVVREWVSKAEGDFAAARTLLGADGPPWVVCFHAQQAVEKYLKTLLILNGTPFRKAHDIDELLRMIPEHQRPVMDAEAASDLTRHAVASRYPEAPEPSPEGGAPHLRSRRPGSGFRPDAHSSSLPRTMSEFEFPSQSSTRPSRGRASTSNVLLKRRLSRVLARGSVSCSSTASARRSRRGESTLASRSRESRGRLESCSNTGAAKGDSSAFFFSARRGRDHHLPERGPRRFLAGPGDPARRAKRGSQGRWLHCVQAVRLVDAVNADAQFGIWAYAIAKKPEEVRRILREA